MGKKKDGVVKKQEVINHFQDFPDAKPAEVMAALARRGIPVSVSLVGNTKTKMRAEARKVAGQAPQAATTKAPTTKAPTTKAPTTKAPTTKAPTTKAPKKKATKKKAAGTKAAAPTGGQKLSADYLFEAKKLADELGGIEKSRQALDYLERLR